MNSKLIILLIGAFITNLASAESILIIGDSLSCGPFGKYLAKSYVQKGNQVTLFCAVSSAPQNWIKGKNPAGQTCKTMTSPQLLLTPCGGNGDMPTLSSILAANKSDKIVVGLGTNSLLSAKADASYKNMAFTIQQSGKKCDWIGPPHLNSKESKGFPPGRVATLESNLNGFYASLPPNIGGPCRLIDSRAATAPGTVGNETSDGVHRIDSAGRYWVDHMDLSNQLEKAKLTSELIADPAKDIYIAPTPAN